MLRLIPAPFYRLALRAAFRVRHHWRRLRKATADGVSVIGSDLEGQVLLVRHSYGPAGWFFPGGGVGRGEMPEQAARRELREETGCDIDGLKLLGTLDEEISGAPHKAHIFAGTVNEMPRPDGREILEARFFPTHSLPEPLGPRTRERLKMWQARMS